MTLADLGVYHVQSSALTTETNWEDCEALCYIILTLAIEVHVYGLPASMPVSYTHLTLPTIYSV